MEQNIDVIITSAVASVQNGEGYRCKSARCGFRVLKIARDIDVNCIFLDMRFVSVNQIIVSKLSSVKLILVIKLSSVKHVTSLRSLTLCRESTVVGLRLESVENSLL